MIRGTTPKLCFKLPFDTNILKECFITFNQNNKIILEKTLKDCLKKSNSLYINLTQEETLSFATNNNIKIQLRAKTIDGNVIASNIIIVSAGEILKEGVI